MVVLTASVGYKPLVPGPTILHTLHVHVWSWTTQCALLLPVHQFLIPPNQMSRARLRG